MKRLHKAGRHRNEDGSVAVEAAVILPLLLIFLTLPSIFLAFYFRQYSATQKAVHDAALYLSTAPRAEMTTAGPDGNFAAITMAKKIIARELAGVIPSGQIVSPEIYCKYRLGSGTPTRGCTITYTKNPDYTLHEFDVGVAFNYINPITGSETSILIAPYAAVRYVGN